MSLRATAWALDQRVGDKAAKLVLLALADEADSFGNATPGLKLIGYKAECSRSTVKRALEYLEAKGMVRSTNRGRRKDGLHFTTLYQLPLDAHPLTEDSPEPTLIRDRMVTHHADRGGRSTMNLPLEAPEHGALGGSTVDRGRFTAVDRGVVIAVNPFPSSPEGKGGEGSTPPPATPPKTEAEDLVPVLAEVVGISLAELTPAARLEITRQAAQLHDVGATSDEVRRRAQRWRDRPRNRTKGRALEVRFLVADWAALAGRPAAQARTQHDAAELDARSRAEGDLRILGNPPDLVRAKGESWTDFAARCEAAFQQRRKVG